MLEVIVDSIPVWERPVEDWTVLAERAAAAAVGQTPHGEMLSSPAAFEISVKLADDAEVQALNAAYRNKDAPDQRPIFSHAAARLHGGDGHGGRWRDTARRRRAGL